MANDHICKLCGLSKDPKKAKYVHTRLGLDEAPELALCKCKLVNQTIRSIKDRISTLKFDEKTFDTENTTDANDKVPINPVDIKRVIPKHYTEIEAMENGFFGDTKIKNIKEIGCTKWTNKPFNVLSKIRTTTGEGSVIKIPLFDVTFMPGIVLTISNEYKFVGKINKPHYSAHIVELSVKTVVDGIEFTINSRQYNEDDKVTYASEIEFTGKPTYPNIVYVVSIAKCADHDVLDVSDSGPGIIVRKLKNKYDDIIADKTYKIDSDGYICIDAVKTVVYGRAYPDMLEGGVYEITVTFSSNENLVTLSNPVRRLIK
ncbi:hypothetical protein QBC39DRAFT_333876 [Podospora conica]|nr:hypothetical protein QBC39DRAFT_333876 [Schizothecium conicum]